MVTSALLTGGNKPGQVSLVSILCDLSFLQVRPKTCPYLHVTVMYVTAQEYVANSYWQTEPVLEFESESNLRQPIEYRCQQRPRDAA